MSCDKKTMQRNLRRARRKEVRYEPLEPRVLLSADIVPLEVDAKEAMLAADELIVDVDLDQVEEASRFVIEGLEPVEVPEAIVTEVDDPEAVPSDAPSPDENEPSADIEAPPVESPVPLPAGDAQQLLAAYWQGLKPSVAAEAQPEVRREVIVVDSAVEDRDTLIRGLIDDYVATQPATSGEQTVEVVDEPAGDSRFALDRTVRIATADDRTAAEVRIVVLDGASDGLDQLSDLLSSHENLAALHLIAHGSSGALRLGSNTVNSETLARRANQVKGWGGAFKADGDILLYGCNVSDDGYGVEFTRALGELTEADIASSDDVTGAGGDWQLESRTGDVTAAALAAPGWAGSLALVDSIPGIADVSELADEILDVLDRLAALADALGSLTIPAELGADVTDFAFLDDLAAVLSFAGDAAPTGTTIAEIVTDLQGKLDTALAGTSFDGALSISAGFDDVAEELRFKLTGDILASVDSTIASASASFEQAIAAIAGDPDLAALLSGDVAGVDLPDITGDISLSTLLRLDVDFGLSLSAYLASDTPLTDAELFVGVNELEAELRMTVSDLDAADLVPGDVSLGVEDASLTLGATVAASFAAGDGQGRLDAAAIQATAAADLFDFSDNAAFRATLPVVAGIDGLGELASLGQPIVYVDDATMGDDAIDVRLDFILGDELRSALTGLFTGFELDLDSLDLVNLLPELPFELPGVDFGSLGLQPLLDALNGLFDFSALGDALTDFYELFDALTLFKGLGLPGFDWDAPDFDWQGIFGVPDFDGFKLRYDAVLERLLPGFDLPSLGFEQFKLDIAALDLSDLRAAFASLLDDLEAAFDFELSADFELDELLTAIDLNLGELPTLNGLSAFLEGMLPVITGFDADLGPLRFDIRFDADSREVAVDFDLDVHRVDRDIFGNDNIDALTDEINALLANLADADFLESLGIDASELGDFNFDLPAPPAEVPAFDLRTDIGLAFTVGASLASLIDGNGFDSDRDGFFELHELDTVLTLGTTDLAFDVELLDDLTLNVLEGTDLSVGGTLSGRPSGRVALGDLAGLDAVVSLDATVPFDSHLLVGLSGNFAGGVFDALGELGAPAIRLYDPNLLDNGIASAGDFLSDLNLEIDFVLGADFRAAIGNLFADFDLDLTAIDLPLPDVDLPIDLGLAFGEFMNDLLGKIRSLVDVDLLSALITDFLDLYDALEMFEATALPGFDWAGVSWPDVFGVADFDAFLDRYGDVLARLLPDVDVPSLDFPSFELAVADLDLGDLRAAFGDLLESLERAFDFELSPDFDLNELLEAIGFHLGQLPTISALGAYLSELLVEAADLDVELGPLDLGVRYLSYELPGGETARELRFEFGTALADALRGLTFADIADGLQQTINEGLRALDGVGLGGETIDLPDNIADLFPGGFDPLVDLAARLDFAAALVLRIEDLFEGNASDLDRNDLYFEWTGFDAALDITLRELGLTLGDGGFSGSVLDEAYLSLPTLVSGALVVSPTDPRGNQIALFADGGSRPTIADLPSLIDWNADIGFDSFLPFDLEIAGFELGDIGIPSISLFDAALGEGDPIDVDFDLLLADGLRATITDVLDDMANGIRSAVDAIDLSSLGVAGIQGAVDDILAEFDSLADLGSFAGDYFTLADAFASDPDDSLSELGNILGLNRDFDSSDAGDREALRRELNFQNGTAIESIDEDEVANYNVEILSLVDPSFDIGDWVSALSDLLGLDDVASYDDIRLDALNWFKTPASVKGLLDFVTTLLPDTIGGESGGLSFGVDFDNRTLDLGIALNPSFETTVADIVAALSDLIAGAAADLGDIDSVLGGDRVDETGSFLPDFGDLAAGIRLLADFAFDVNAQVDLSDFSSFTIADDVTIGVTELNAGLAVVGENLDFIVSVGGLDIGIENASLGLNVDVEMLGLADSGAGSNFSGTLAEFRAVIAGLDTLIPSLFGDYAAELPFILDIPISGSEDLALDEFVQPIFSIEDEFEYTYDTDSFVEVDGFDPALSLALGVNLGNTVGEPLESLLDELADLGVTSYKLPLVNQSLEDILRIETFLSNVVAAFKALPLLTVSLDRAGNGDLSIGIDQAFLDEFSEQFTGVLKTAIADLLRISENAVVGDGLVVVYANGELDLSLDLGLAIDAGVEIDIDLAELISNFVAGANLDDFLQLEASADIGIRGDVSFGFDLTYRLEDQLFGNLAAGEDAVQLGDLGLGISLDQFGAENINARAGVDIPQEFIDSIGSDEVEAIIERLEELAQIAIEGGSASFLVADAANPGEFLDLFTFDYDSAGGSWTPELNAGFTVDLPVFIADGLRLTWTETDDQGNETSFDSISLEGAFNGTDLSSFSIDPPALPEVSQIGDQIKLMLLINSPAYLVSAVDQVASLFDRDDPDSIFNRLLYGDGGLGEKLAELEIPLVGDIVADVAEALEGVVNEVIDGFSTVLMGIAAGLEAIGIDEDTTLDELIQDAIAEMFTAIESAIQSVLDGLGLDVTVPALLTNLNFSELNEFLGDRGTTTDAFRSYLADEGQDDLTAIGDADFDRFLEDFLATLGIFDDVPSGIAKGLDANRGSNYVRVSEDDLAEGRLEFEFQLGLTIFEKSVDIDFEAAVPGLPLELEVGDNSMINFSSELTLDLGFGFDVTASSIGDFMYVATDRGGVFDGTTNDYGEFKFTLGADLGDEFSAMANLGFLQAAVGYNLSGDPEFAGIDGFDKTMLEGSIIVDFVDSTLDADGEIDEQMSLGDLASFSVADNLVGVADIRAQSDLRARLGLGTQLGDIDYSGDLQNFDGVDGLIVGGGVDVRYQQQYGRSLFGGDPGIVNGAELIFENLHLDVGFLAELIAPVLDAINEYIAPPIDAIAELLEIEVGLLGDIGLVPGDNYSGTAIGDPDTTELVDVLVLVADILSAVPDPRARAAGTAIDALVQLVGVGKSIVDVAAQLGDVADQGILNFGTIRLGDRLTSDQDLIDLLGIASLDEIFDIETRVAPDAEDNAVDDDQLQQDLRNNFDRADSPFNSNPNNPNNDLKLPSTRPDVEVQFNVTLPVLESPLSALNLVIGKPTDIVNFAFDFSLEFGAETKVPLAGPLSALFDLGFALGADIDIGFNTRGIAETIGDLAVGEFPDDASFLLDGLLEGVYFDDHVVGGVDNPEIWVDAKLLAGLSAGIPGLVEASVYGGVTGELNIDWADNLANTDTLGRFYLDELIDTVSQRGLECIFDISGSLDAELGWSVWVGLDAGFFTVTVFEDSDVFLRENIVTFIHTCNVKSPALASLGSDGELRLNIGDRASFRAAEQFQPAGLPAGTNFVDYDPNDPEYAGTIRSTSANYAVAYKVTEDTHDFEDGAGEVDAIVVESEGIKQYFRKADVNKISGAGRGVQTVFDVDGNPIGTRGDLIVLDLDAPDIEVDISGGNEADQFRADGVYKSVTIDGGGGNDVLVAAGITDAESVTLLGGTGNDQIAGSALADLIVGGAGDDILAGGAGDDVIWGYNENNAGALGNQTDRDKIRGDEGADRINAGPQNDVVSWVRGDGSDLLVTGGDTAAQDALNLVGYETDADTGAADAVTLSRANTDIVLDWNGVEGFTFSNFASISVDVGAGADTVVVDDLSNTTVGAVNVDLGGSSSLSTESVWLDQDGNVIRYTDNVPAVYRADVFETYAEDTFTEQVNGDWISSDQVNYVEIDRKRYSFDGQDFIEDDEGDFFRTVDDEYVAVAGQTRYLRFLKGEVILDADGNRTLLHAAGDPILNPDGSAVIRHAAGDIVREEIQARRIAAGDLFGDLEAEVRGETRLVSTRSSDGDQDTLTFIGSDQADGIELFSKRNLVFGDIDYGLEWNGVVDNPGFSEDFVLNLAQLDSFDAFIVDAGAGDDVIDARTLQDVIPTNVDSRVGQDGEADPEANPESSIDRQLLLLTLYGNDGADRILGSELSETIVGGRGADTIFGNAGVDIYQSPLYPETGALIHEHVNGELQVDTLVAQRDADFKLTDTELHIGDSEVENLANLFEAVVLVGGASNNTFTIGRIGDTQTPTDVWRYDLIMDGGAGADSYDVWLSGFGRPAGIFDDDPPAEIRLLDGGSNTGPDGQSVFEELGLDDEGLRILGGGAGLTYRAGKDQGLDLRTDVLTINAADDDDAFHFDAVDKNGRALAGYNADGRQVDANGDLLDLDGFVERIDAADDLEAVFQSINADEIAENLDTVDDSIANPDIRGVSVGGDVLRQRVYYNSAEQVVVHGWGGDDLFIVDNNTEQLKVYGDVGEDSFFIGNVKRTVEWTPPGQDSPIDIIDGETGISDGVTVQSEFFGGEQDDYFEVNRNRGRLSLYGDNGDDTFFLRAHLIGDGTEIESEKVSASAGDENGEVADSDNDALVNYLRNNEVDIIGGGGFDTLVVAGTALADDFYVFTEFVDGVEVQRIYGAGLAISRIDSVERLMILTAGGDDNVYLYGTLAGQELLVNTGGGDDTIYVGGDTQRFEVEIPAATNVEVVPLFEQVRSFADSVIETNFFDYYSPVKGYEAFIPAFRLPVGETALPRDVLEEWFDFFGNFWYFSAIGWAYNFQYINAGFDNFVDFFSEVIRSRFYGEPDTVALNAAFIEFTELNLIEPFPQYNIELPAFTLDLTANSVRDLGSLAGPVRLTDIGGNDRIIIDNSLADDGAENLLLSERLIEKAEFTVEEDPGVLADLFSGDERFSSGYIDAGEVAGSLSSQIRRDNQVKNPGLVTRMLDGDADGLESVSLAAGQKIYEFDNEADVNAYLSQFTELPPDAQSALNSAVTVYQPVPSYRPENLVAVYEYGWEEPPLEYTQTDPDGELLAIRVTDTSTGSLVAVFTSNASASALTQYDDWRRAPENQIDPAVNYYTYSRVENGVVQISWVYKRTANLDENGRPTGGFEDELLVEFREENFLSAASDAGLSVAFDEAGIEAYVTAVFGVEVRPQADVQIDPPEWPKRFEANVADSDGNRFRIEVVGFANAAAPDEIVGWSVYALDVLTLDVPNAFVTGRAVDSNGVEIPWIYTPHDTILYDYDDGALAEQRSLYYAGFESIDIELGDADNRIEVESTSYLDDMTIRTGAGSDVIRFGEVVGEDADGDEIESLAGIAADVVVDAGNDDISTDLIQLSASNNTGALVGEISDELITGFELGGGISYRNADYLEVTTGSAADEVTVTATHEDIVTFLNTGDADDVVLLRSALDSVDPIEGELRIDVGGGGDNRLLVVDTGDLSGDRIELDIEAGIVSPLDGASDLFGRVAGMSPGLIYYRGDDETAFQLGDGLVLRTSSGDDEVAVRNLYRGNLTELFTGLGDDAVIVDGFSIAGRAADLPDLTVYGEAGDDFVDASAAPIGVTLYGNLPDIDVAAGGSDDDTLLGSAHADRIQSNGGDDIVVGNDGADTIDAGDGNNVVLGDRGVVAMSLPLGIGPNGERVSIASGDPEVGGADTILAGDGDNVIIAGAGGDTVTTGSGDNIVFGDHGRVSYSGADLDTVASIDDALGGDDTLTSGPGDSVQIGGAGDDALLIVEPRDGSPEGASGIAFRDRIAAILQNGNPVFSNAAEPDVQFGDNGFVDYDDGRIVRIESQSDGTGGADTLVAANGTNVQIGGYGDDTLIGGSGRDIQIGDGGVLEFLDGLPLLVQTVAPGTGGNDSIDGGSGIDVQMGGAGADAINGGAGTDYQLGDVGIAKFRDGGLVSFETAPFFIGDADNIVSGTGNDLLFGGEGSDTFNATFIDDTIIGYYGRVLLDPDGTIISVVILGVNGTDLVGSELGTLLLPLSDVQTLEEALSVRTRFNGGAGLNLDASVDPALFPTSAPPTTGASGPAEAACPPDRPDGNQYTVVPGDTLSEIMQSFGLRYPRDLDGVLENNGLIEDPDHVEAGWTLTIGDEAGQCAPAGGPSTSELQTSAEHPKPAEGEEDGSTAAAALAAAAGLNGWKLTRRKATVELDEALLEELDTKAARRRFARWKGQRIVSGKVWR